MTQPPPTTRWTMVVVSHSHWDREWYLPFQAFRLKLVGMICRLLDILKADPRYRCFMLDGQTVILDDFAEAAPQRFAELAEQIRAGRILVGPWFVLPDEFLVSGEALIRNLQRGIATAEQCGEPMRLGYLPDAFGHIAEMPQILQGFGVDAAALWRGVPGEATATEFVWEAPDGSKVLTVFLIGGYFNAGGLPTDPDGLRVRIEEMRQGLAPRATTPYLLLMNGGDHVWPQAELPEILDRARELFPDAEIVHGSLPELVRLIRQVEHRGEVGPWLTIRGELRSGERAHLLPGVLSSRMWIKQRNDACQTLLERWAEPFAALSARACDADVPGPLPADAVGSLLDLAWRYLLLNHPHDSICGCSVDQVHEEMRHRFDSAEQIAGQIAADSLQRLAAAVATGEAAADPAASAIVVFNAGGTRTDFVRHWLPTGDGAGDVILADANGTPTPYQILGRRESEIVAADVSREDLQRLLALVKPDAGEWTQPQIDALEAMLRATLAERLANAIVTRVDIRPSLRPRAVQVVLSVAEHGRHDYTALAEGLGEIARLAARGDVDRFELRVGRREAVEIGFVAAEVPGWGYRTYTVRPGHRRALPPPAAAANHWIENEFLIVQVNPRDATFSIIDKETGAVYEGLNRFADTGDAGDEYNFNPPAGNTTVSQPAEPPVVRLVEAGPIRWTLDVAFELALPRCLAPDRRSRAAETVRCPVRYTVSLTEAIPRVDVHAVVVNQAADHRLQVAFPSRIKTDHAAAESHFGVVERRLTMPTNTQAWLEQPATTAPQRSFVDVSDGQTGLLVANRGLPEYEVLPESEGATVAITLLRCVGWLSRDDLEVRRGHAGPPVETPGAQCPGEHRFDYALVPHAGDWRSAFHLAHQFAVPLRAVTTGLHPGDLPPVAGLIRVEPDEVVVSAIRDRDGDLVVRVLNQSPEPQSARIGVLGRPSRAVLADLREQPTDVALPLDGSSLTIHLRPHQLATVRFGFDRAPGGGG
ncbi:MAG: hypothetical protein HY331_18425 [Chloroflexi bacterium]|nr:hypothetical protein [Chloroflexota bacterium]